MGSVETMRGPVDAADLGVTLMHEHLFILNPEIQQNYETEFDAAVEVPAAIERMKALKAAGVDTIVDLTVIGLGRDLDLMRQVADATDVHILAATGLYTYDELPTYFMHRGGPGTLLGGDEPMIEMFLADVEHGIAGSGVKPAIIKCATDEAGVTPDVERVLRACARVHRATGLPISTHTHAESERGVEQQRVFEDEGVDLSRVVIGHSGDTTDRTYLEALLAKGSYLGMDRFGVDVMLPFEERVGIVADLCSAGFADRLVLSHDTSCHIDWMPVAVRDFMPNWRYTHISEDVLPALRERGVTEPQIEQMLVTNPRAILDHQGGY
jgi:phosphotriesterase-related protein